MNPLLGLFTVAAIGFVAWASATEPPVSDTKRLLVHIESMAEIMDVYQDDCDKLGDELSSFAKANGKEISELSKNVKDGREAEVKYKDRIEKATEKMMGGMMKCADNEKVMKALQEIKME